MNVIERTVVIEVGIEGDGLVVGRTADVLNTRLLVLGIVVVQCNNHIPAIVVAPGRLVGSILVVERSRVRCGIVHSYQRMETQALRQRAKVSIHTCVELELTAGPSVVASSISVGNHVGQVSLCSA